MMVQPWWPLSPWLSPGAAWFIFFNAVVAAIAVMSSCSCAQQDAAGHVPSSRRRLRRSASSVLLDQLRSLSLFSVANPTADDQAGVSDSDLCSFGSQEAELVASTPRLAHQASMVVPETPRPTAACAVVPPPSAPAAMALAADSALAPESKDEDDDAEEVEQDVSISLDEAYAMVQQSRRRQPPSAPAATAATIAVASLPKKKDLATKAPKRRRPEAEAAVVEGKAELNARAELFIRQFREELKLQRLNSLLRHTHAFGTRDGAPSAVR